jgi:acetolactate synthase-1/2/3 large subunit
LVLVVGSRFNATFYYGEFGPETRVMQVDCNAAALGDNRGIDLGICGDARLVLEQLAAAYRASATPIHPMRLLHEINEFADRRTTITVDGGDIGVAAARHLRAERPGCQLSNASTLGSLGPGLPFALGAKVASPEDTVICVTGDGAFGIGAMEMDISPSSA